MWWLPISFFQGFPQYSFRKNILTLTFKHYLKSCVLKNLNFYNGNLFFFRIIHRQKNRKEGSKDAVDAREEDDDVSEEEHLPNQSSGQSLWSSSAAPLWRLAPVQLLLLSLALIVRAVYWILELVNICKQTFKCQNFIWASIHMLNTFNSLMIISNKTLYDRIIYHFIVKMWRRMKPQNNKQISKDAVVTTILNVSHVVAVLAEH